MDKEILREIWQGRLPLCFKLHPDDVSGMHCPEPYYMMVPRVTYFPLVLDRVVKYFNRFIDQNKQVVNEMWLDYEGQPIKWHHPIGLSWDLFGSSYDLPWRLILHFSEFPANELVRCNTKASIETSFMSSIKEADALKHKGTIMKNMVKKDHNQLWSSLLNDKFDQFWLINQRLMDRLDNELFRYVPFRLYLPDSTYIQKLIRPCTTERQIFHDSSKQNETKSSIQIPIVFDTDIVINRAHKCSHSPINIDEANRTTEGHRCTTMLDLIQVCFINRLNDLLISQEVSPIHTVREKEDYNTTTKGHGGDGDDEIDEDNDDDDDDDYGEEKEEKIKGKSKLESEKNDLLFDVKSFRYRFLTHGIEIPFDTPLQWLSEHFSYPDNFLHICALVK